MTLGENMASLHKNTFPIKSFSIKGLYGYKTLQFKTTGKTTVVVSENGSGKTTLLNALDYVLHASIDSLVQMDFSIIEINIGTPVKKYLIKKEELVSHKQIDFKEYFDGYDDDYDESYSNEEITSAIISMEDLRFFERNDVLMTLYRSVPEARSFFIRKLEKIKDQLIDRHTLKTRSIENLFSIRDFFKGNDCIYLPTYRRVEKAFEKSKKNNYSRSYIIKERDTRSLEVKYNKITYGLNDVEDILAKMSFDIERQSNIGYRQLSAEVLEDLLRNETLDRKKGSLPDLNNLKRFLNRVRTSINKRDSILKKLELFYKGETNVKDDNTQYLNYFLSRLNDVINETKELESKIESFVNECNKYLKLSGDSKEILFDPNSLKVQVIDIFTKKQIQLNDLSSGEKQVISFMSILYLTNKKEKIILIDEPELSLSLDWQRKILPDINKCDNVAQVIAITHSPFIFENELDKNATPLKISKEKL